MGKVTDVTSSTVKLNSALMRIKDSNISDENKKLIKDFAISLRRENLKKNSIIIQVNTLKWMCEHLQKIGNYKQLFELSQEEFDSLLIYLEDDIQYKPGNINLYKKAFKKFSKWKLCEDIPSWIVEIKQQKVQTRVQPADLPTKEEFLKFLEAAKHPRDKALIAVCADGGLRIGALLSCKVSSVELTKHGAIIYLSREGANKTTLAKGIPLTWASGYLGQWLAIHPLRNDANAPLWTTLKSHSGVHEALTYDGAYQMFLNVGKIAGLKKHIHPHLMRHYAVTSWILDGLREADINHRAGWTRDSKQMWQVYGNFTEAEINDRIWEHYGLKTEDKRTVTLKKCPRCNNILKSGDKFCSQCALILDQVTAQEMDKEKTILNIDLLSIFEQDPEQLVKFADMLKNLKKD